MTAKEVFKKLGFTQKIYNSKRQPSSSGIQYMKKSHKESELEKVGLISTKYIEFYFLHKEIVVYTTYLHRDGSTSKSDVGILSFEEFNAVQKQVEELEWQSNI